MTKQQKWTPESPIEACATTYESLAKALGGLQNKFEIPEAAREFVKRSAAAAKDRSSDLHAGANKATGAVEEALVAIDKLASAESLTDAFETYVDYLRQQSKVGVARAKDAASLVSTKASEGFDALRDGIDNFMTVRSQAA